MLQYRLLVVKVTRFWDQAFNDDSSCKHYINRQVARHGWITAVLTWQLSWIETGPHLSQLWLFHVSGLPWPLWGVKSFQRLRLLLISPGSLAPVALEAWTSAWGIGLRLACDATKPEEKSADSAALGWKSLWSAVASLHVYLIIVRWYACSTICKLSWNAEKSTSWDCSGLPETDVHKHATKGKLTSKEKCCFVTKFRHHLLIQYTW